MQIKLILFRNFMHRNDWVVATHVYKYTHAFEHMKTLFCEEDTSLSPLYRCQSEWVQAKTCRGKKEREKNRQAGRQSREAEKKFLRNTQHTVITLNLFSHTDFSHQIYQPPDIVDSITYQFPNPLLSLLLSFAFSKPARKWKEEEQIIFEFSTAAQHIRSE